MCSLTNGTTLNIVIRDGCELMGADEERHPLLEDEEERRFQEIYSLFICYQSTGPQTQTLPHVTTFDPHSDHSYYIWILQSPDHDGIILFLESPFHNVYRSKSKFIYSLYGHHLIRRRWRYYVGRA